MSTITRKTTKGYALQIGPHNDQDRVFVQVREDQRPYDYWTSKLTEATLFTTPEAAVQRVSEIAYFNGVRYGSRYDTSYHTHSYRVVRVVETVGEPTTTDCWYIRRGSDMWFKYGLWFTSNKADATRFSGIGHAINALRDWANALNNRGTLGPEPLTIVHELVEQAAPVTLTTEILE